MPEIRSMMKRSIVLYLVLFYIVYRYLCSASPSHDVSQTEALSVHFSSRKKVRLKGEGDEERGAERINQRK